MLAAAQSPPPPPPPPPQQRLSPAHRHLALLRTADWRQSAATPLPHANGEAEKTRSTVTEGACVRVCVRVNSRIFKRRLLQGRATSTFETDLGFFFVLFLLGGGKERRTDGQRTRRLPRALLLQPPSLSISASSLLLLCLCASSFFLFLFFSYDPPTPHPVTYHFAASRELTPFFFLSEFEPRFPSRWKYAAGAPESWPDS